MAALEQQRSEQEEDANKKWDVIRGRRIAQYGKYSDLPPPARICHQT